MLFIYQNKLMNYVHQKDWQHKFKMIKKEYSHLKHIAFDNIENQFGEKSVLLALSHIIDKDYVKARQILENLDSTSLRHIAQWLLLECAIYFGEFDYAEKIYDELIPYKKSGEIQLICSLYELYVNQNILKAKKHMTQASIFLEADYLFDDEKAYRLIQLDQVKKIIDIGEKVG